METYATTFQKLLLDLKGDKAIEYGLGLLESREVDIPVLYEQIIATALHSIEIPRSEESLLIWREHYMTAHCRSLVENCRPFVLAAASCSPKPNYKKVMIFSPSEEYHELGMRMGADFFTLIGAEVAYIGANLPLSNLPSALAAFTPDLVCISIANPLNLTSVDEYCHAIRTSSAKPVVLALAGSASVLYDRNKTGAESPDLFLNSYADILRAGGGTI